MNPNLRNYGKTDVLPVCFFMILSIFIYFYPTGFEKKEVHDAIRCKGRVTATENSEIQRFGIVKSGDQALGP